MPHPPDELDLSVSEGGDYRRTDDGPVDDTITMNRELGASVPKHEPTPPPAPRSKVSSTNLVLPGLRDQIQAPPPEEKPGIPPWAKYAVGGGIVAVMLFVGLIAVSTVWWTTSGSSEEVDQEELERQRREVEEAIGVPVRDGLSNKKKRN
jgi:hypothetical protein